MGDWANSNKQMNIESSSQSLQTTANNQIDYDIATQDPADFHIDGEDSNRTANGDEPGTMNQDVRYCIKNNENSDTTAPEIIDAEYHNNNQDDTDIQLEDPTKLNNYNGENSIFRIEHQLTIIEECLLPIPEPPNN